MKRLARSVLRWILLGWFHIFRIIPFKFSYVVVPYLMKFLWLFLGKKKQVARENLRRAFPEKSDAEIRRIVSASFDNLSRVLIEDIYYCHDRTPILERVRFEGLENLEAALAEGNGVVMTTAHLGNFPLMMVCLAHLKHNVHIILKPAHDPKVNRFLEAEWNKCGTHMIYALPRRTCVSQALKVLRNNGLLFILPDQNFGDEGRVFVPFFGRLAATGIGPFVFSRRTKAAVVPVFMVRQSDGTHRLIIEKAMPTGDSEESLPRDAYAITQRIENYIRRYPEQWLWFHKRWKTQPEAKDVIYQP